MNKADKLRRDWQKEDEALIDTAVDALLKAPNGRQFLWWLLQIGRVGGQPFANNALNTSFNCGELNVGNRILERIITVSPDGYVGMLKEQEDARRSRDAALADADAASGRDYTDGDADGA